MRPSLSLCRHRQFLPLKPSAVWSAHLVRPQLRRPGKFPPRRPEPRRKVPVARITVAWLGDRLPGGAVTAGAVGLDDGAREFGNGQGAAGHVDIMAGGYSGVMRLTSILLGSSIAGRVSGSDSVALDCLDRPVARADNPCSPTPKKEGNWSCPRSGSEAAEIGRPSSCRNV